MTNLIKNIIGTDKMIITCNKTGLNFKFDNHKQKEEFFNLWDKYEVLK